MNREVRGEILKNIAEVLSQFREVVVGYVFGSLLPNEKFEDIDVGLLLAEPLSPYQGMKFAMRVARELERAVKPRYEFDVKILNLSPIHFQYQVIKGEAVFSRDEINRIRYEAGVLSDYLDYRDAADWLDQEFIVRV